MLFERPDAGSRALVLHIETGARSLTSRSEFSELSLTAGLFPVVEAVTSRRNPDPKTFIGSGKLADIKYLVEAADCQVALVDQDLNPTQERNLEAALGIAVRGRTGLILDIFAQRARTHEGKLQVELAQLHHQSARLVRGWTHLDRQRGGGGAGVLGGAGETQLEADQRILGTRMKQVNRQLAKVRKGRDLNRRGRNKAGVRSISLVGYTNAGKSTAFNRLCDAHVVARNQLFATLDPTLRRLELPGHGAVVVSDTVGFIRKLPHTLIDAFRATLEEVCQAHLLIHVIDASAADKDDQMADVEDVLREIGADEVPRLDVYNKIDLLGVAPRIDYCEAGTPRRVWVSAASGAGLPLLRQAISNCLVGDIVEKVVQIGSAQGKLRAALYAMGAITREEFGENGDSQALVRGDSAELDQILAHYGT